MRGSFVHTSESVTAAHPDKLCDRISDAVVDAYLDADPLARVSAECVLANGIIFLAARFASDAVIDLGELARRETTDVGYGEPELDPRRLSVMTTFGTLPAASRLERLDIDPDTLPAGQLVTAFGFAADDTADLMPMPIWLAHGVARALHAAAREQRVAGLSPDAVAQVAIRYDGERPVEIDAVTVEAASWRDDRQTSRAFEDAVLDDVVRPALAAAELPLAREAALLVNPTGPPAPGGPYRHTGLTGRKLAVDTYGGFARHAGSALSGKDPWRIDRSATCAARWCAKLIVAAGLARRCEVQLSYRTDRARPSSVEVQSFATGALDDATLARRLAERLDLRPAALARALGLAGAGRVRFAARAAYGQVGGGAPVPGWESTSSASRLVD
ncbi:MAG: methionine adenosyltransferase domain-containing protein [Alphaproteobacteria bacterium]